MEHRARWAQAAIQHPPVAFAGASAIRLVRYLGITRESVHPPHKALPLSLCGGKRNSGVLLIKIRTHLPYQGVPSYLTGNYVDPDDYMWRQRFNPVFTIGRLSRADPMKYPMDFPVFYEELGLKDARYRVMAWGPEVQRQFRWHRFGPEWELLSANKEEVSNFLYSLDLFVYPLGQRVKESWGRVRDANSLRRPAKTPARQRSRALGRRRCGVLQCPRARQRAMGMEAPTGPPRTPGAPRNYPHPAPVLFWPK